MHAVFLALTAPHADRETFLVGDQECVTWSDLYRPIAEALGFDLDQVPEGAVEERIAAWQDRFEKIRTSNFIQAAIAFLPTKLKWAAFKAISSWNEGLPPTPWESLAQQKSLITHEMAMLYQCQYKFFFEKARKILGYKPVVPFPEACQRTVAWLAFAGYPIVTEGKPLEAKRNSG